MYEQEQRNATQRAAAHKAHVTRKTSRLAEIENEIEAMVAKLSLLQTEADELRGQIQEQTHLARRADYQRRGYRAAATRAA